MSETINFDELETSGSLDDFELDSELMSEASSLDGNEEPQQDDDDTSTLFADGDEDLAAEMVVDGFEFMTQLFGHERYEIPETRKALLVGAYGRLMKKYENKAPAWLGEYKEELIVIVVTLFVMGSAYSSVSALKKEDQQLSLSSNGGDDGEKSQ